MTLDLEKYTWRDGETALSAAELNARFWAVVRRLHALELLSIDWSAAVAEVRNYGLARINEGVVPLLDALRGDLDALMSQGRGDLATLTTDVEALLTRGNGTLDAVTAQIGALIDADGRVVNDHMPLFAQTGATTTRSMLSKLRDVLHPMDFGAVGDGVTDSTAAFAALEAAFPGASVDLRGRTFKVDALPRKAQYINGVFLTPDDAFRMRKTPLRHPLDGNSFVSLGDGQTHMWLFGVCHDPVTGNIFALVKQAHRHAQSYGAPLFLYISEDGGCTWGPGRTVYSLDGWDIADGNGGPMYGGRLGFFLYRRTTSLGRCDFLYTDDSGDTWSVVSDVLSGERIFPYGPMLPYPAAVGGNDAGGYICYGYSSSLGINAAITLDNGLTWTRTPILGMEASAGYTEISVTQVNDEKKWIMALRNDATDLLYLSVSTDMVTWTTPVYSGIPAGSNPPLLFVMHGILSLFLFLRDFDEYRLVGENNSIACWQDDPLAVFNSVQLSSLAYEIVATPPDRALGYLRVCRVGQDVLWGYTAGELGDSTASAAPSTVVFGSTRAWPGAGVSLVRTSRSRPNLLRNGTFRLWNRETSFTPETGVAAIADGWEIYRSGSTVTVSREELTAAQSKLFPFNPRYGCRITATADDYIAIRQKLYGAEWPYLFSDAVIGLQAHGFGPLPAGLAFSVHTYCAPQTTLASGITAEATTLAVAAGAGASLPDPATAGPWYADITATGETQETVQVTALSGDTLTVTRGRQDTTAHAWSAGAYVTIQSPASKSVPITSYAALATGTWRAEAQFQSRDLEGYVLGPNPYVQIGLSNWSTVSAWDFVLVGMKAELGEVSNFEPPLPAREALECGYYLRELVFPSAAFIGIGTAISATQFYVVVQFDKMANIPYIRATGVTGTELQTYSPATITTTALTFNTAGNGAIRITGTVSGGLTPGQAYPVRVVPGSSLKLILDGEY